MQGNLAIAPAHRFTSDLQQLSGHQPGRTQVAPFTGVVWAGATVLRVINHGSRCWCHVLLWDSAAAPWRGRTSSTIRRSVKAGLRSGCGGSADQSFEDLSKPGNGAGDKRLPAGQRGRGSTEPEPSLHPHARAAKTRGYGAAVVRTSPVFIRTPARRRRRTRAGPHHPKTGLHLHARATETGAGVPSRRLLIRCGRRCLEGARAGRRRGDPGSALSQP